MRKKPKIYVLANSSLIEGAISGGDVLLPQTAKQWHDKYEINVVTVPIGQDIWEQFGPPARFFLLKNTIFDLSDRIYLGTFKYLIRTFQATCLIRKLLEKETERIVLLTPSDFFVDAIPAFLARTFFPNICWLARVYHIIESPLTREGNFLANCFSYYAQKIGLFLIRKKADLVVALGGTYQDLVEMKFDLSKLNISNAGVEIETLKRAKPIQEKFEAIEIGMLTRNRGVYDLLEIWDLVRRKMLGARLAIIGGAPQSVVTDYKERIKSMGLEKNVKYFGYIPENKDVYSILKSSKLYLFPGHEDGWSLPVAEAMVVGVPSVVYKMKMFGTAFNKGFMAIPMHDKKAFAEKVLYLLENEGERKKLSKEALVESKYFDWGHVASEMSKYIDGLLR